MRIIFLVVLIFLLDEINFAQQIPEHRCPYKGPQITSAFRGDSVGNFSIRTTDGITRDLYATLDSGKTVFIDLFFSTCSWCQYYAPIIEEIYNNHGAGLEDIEFWGISNDPSDVDAVIDQYKLDHDITNPCAGPQGGGTTAHTTVISGQNFLGWPTYCVVCPDRTMFFDPCYPPTVNGFDPYFETCAAMVSTDDPNPENKSSLMVFPNPAREKFFLQIQNKQTGKLSIEIYNVMGINVLSTIFMKNEDIATVTLDISSLPEGTYFLRLIQGQKALHFEKLSIAR